MEHDDLTDDLNRRLRAARPAAADVDQHAFDGALLARVRQQPIAPRRTRPPLGGGAGRSRRHRRRDRGGRPRRRPRQPRRPAVGRCDHAADPALARPAGRHGPARAKHRDERHAHHHARVLAVGGRADRRTRAGRGRADVRGLGRRALRPGDEHDLRPARAAAARRAPPLRRARRDRTPRCPLGIPSSPRYGRCSSRAR